MQDQDIAQIVDALYYRLRASSGLGKVDILPDDTTPVQNHQISGYQNEIRPGVRRMPEYGHSSMPLPGTECLIIYPGGQRSMGIIVATEDPRYRPTGLQMGEHHLWFVDGAQKDGTGGTLRSFLKVLTGWLVTLFGKSINIGDSNTQTIVVGGSGVTTLNIMVKSGTKVNVTAGGTLSPVMTQAGASPVLQADGP